jgi:DNA-binding MarR family transcriptional regulator
MWLCRGLETTRLIKLSAHKVDRLLRRPLDQIVTMEEKSLAALAYIHPEHRGELHRDEPHGNEPRRDERHQGEFRTDGDEVMALDNNCACAALRSASRAVTQLYDLVLVPTGLKATQFLMLKTIFEAGEIAQCDFARGHAIAIETLSRRFAGLRQKGLVELRIGAHHSERIYRLTPLGKQRFEDAVPYWQLAQRRLRQTLRDADWNVLLELSHKICKAAVAAEQVPMSNHRSSRADASAMARSKLYTKSSK